MPFQLQIEQEIPRQFRPRKVSKRSKDVEDDDDNEWHDAEPLDQEILKKYIIYAKQYVKPVLHNLDQEKVCLLSNLVVLSFYGNLMHSYKTLLAVCISISI
jgi:hypothetical protein